MIRTMILIISISIAILYNTGCFFKYYSKDEGNIYDIEPDKYVLWELGHTLHKENPKIVFTFFEKTIPIDTIAQYFGYNDLYRTIPNSSLISDFIKRNNNQITWPKDILQPVAFITKDKFITSEMLKNSIKPYIDFKTMDTLDQIFINISRPGFSEKYDSALIIADCYTREWDYGLVYLFIKESGFWKLTKSMFLWAHSKEKRKACTSTSLSPSQSMYDTTACEELKKVFGYPSVVNVEEDTLMIRSTGEIFSTLAPVVNQLNEDYINFFKEPRPTGFLDIIFDINCAGEVYNISIYNDEIGNQTLDSIVVNKLFNVKYQDNLRTNRCGKTEVTYLLKFIE